MSGFPLSLPNLHSSLLRITFKIKPVLKGMCNFLFNNKAEDLKASP